MNAFTGNFIQIRIKDKFFQQESYLALLFRDVARYDISNWKFSAGPRCDLCVMRNRLHVTAASFGI